MEDFEMVNDETTGRGEEPGRRGRGDVYGRDAAALRRKASEMVTLHPRPGVEETMSDVGASRGY